ncbi:MAG: hypothetical protein JXK05_04595 [Campylobacterales bacterium]|nr:hypothetical protein [Campylobacterales bacterium]
MIKVVIHADFERYRSELETIDTLFDASAESIHKARNELRLATLGTQRIVIKAFRVPNLLNRIAYAWLRPSKAAKSYANALRLRELGVDTPAPIAYVQEQSEGLFGRSYYVSCYEPYDMTIREVLHHKVDDSAALLDAFVRFTYGLHVKGIWHEDYSPGNILIRREEGGYRFMLVDINRMRFGVVTPKQGCAHFAKLWARPEDLERMAQLYAELSSMNPHTTLELMRRYAQRVVSLKKFKKMLKGKA